MKLLVSCDDYCYCANGRFYLREFGHILVNRYLRIFEEIRLAVRTRYVEENELGVYTIPVNEDRIEIYPIPFFQGPAQYLKMYGRTRKRMKEVCNGCGACIVRLPSTTASDVLNIAKKRKLPYGVEIVANPQDMAKQGGMVSSILWELIHKRLVKECAEADCVSYVTQFDLQKTYPARKANHFETYYSSVELSTDIFYNHRGSKNSIFTLCHVANPIKSIAKGHRTLIDVAKKLSDAGVNVKVKFAGDGELVAYFTNYAESLGISDHIEFVGLLDKNQLYRFFLDADLMVFPSESEGLPRVLIEAMATGLPCLSSPVGGIPELLEDEYLFQPNDVEGFTAKITEIISDKDMYDKMCTRNYKKALEYAPRILERKRDNMYAALKKKAIMRR